MVKTSIIILTYNSEKYIKNLIDSIFEANKGENFEIIVVDNDSQDKTIAIANKFGKKITIYETGANLGFAKGINYGAERAKGEYLLFINPDAVWKSGSIKKLISVFDRNERIGIVGGKMLSTTGVSEKSASKFYGFWTSFITALGLDEAVNIRTSPNIIQRVDAVSGGFMAVKNTIFKKLNGFDESYFMYIEDNDLCYRAKKHGALTYFNPDVAIVHQGQGSSNKAFAFNNIIKGILYFQKKHVNYLSYQVIKMVFLLKSRILVMVGKMLNNKTLVDNYIGVTGI